MWRQRTAPFQHGILVAWCRIQGRAGGDAAMAVV